MTLARVRGRYESLVSAEIREADDCKVALLTLARAFDEHLEKCPHVEPPIPLQVLERNTRHAELIEDASQVRVR